MTKDELTRSIVQLATEMRDVIKASEIPAQVVVVLAVDKHLILASSAGADTGPVLLGALKGVARREGMTDPPAELPEPPVVLQ